MDLTDTIAPKSDQLNAEDLLTGPRTFTVREVRRGGSAEQPVDIELVEFPGRPFKPSKTVRRLLVAAWGVETDIYAGRRMTLYRDPDVKFGGQEVGGIRVSHMSHIDKPLAVALTVTRGKRAPHRVLPLVEDTRSAVTQETLADIIAGLERLGIVERAAKFDAVCRVVGRDLKSARDLTAAEGGAVLSWVASQESGQSAGEYPPTDGGWPPVTSPGGAS